MKDWQRRRECLGRFLRGSRGMSELGLLAIRTLPLVKTFHVAQIV
jgi:hypothetical protein